MANIIGEYTDFSKWTCNSTSCSMSDTYTDGVNNITYRGGSGYERYYVKFENVPLNSDCTFSFKFCSPSGYSYGGYGGVNYDYAFVAPSSSLSGITNTSNGGNNVTKTAQTANYNNSALSTPEDYTVSWNSGAESTWYLVFDFGYIKDGVTITLIISDITFDDGSNPLPEGKAINYTWYEANSFTWDAMSSIPWGSSGLSSGLLLKSGSTIYTIVDGSVTALTDTELTADLFKRNGFTTAPTQEQILSLTDPVIYYWDEDTDSAHTITVTMTATPKPQTIYSDDYDMTDASILGVESVNAVATENVLFGVSFNSGATWMMWTGSAWGVLTEDDTGMTVTVMNAITSENWNAVATTGKIQFRAFLPDTTATITSLVIDFVN